MQHIVIEFNIHDLPEDGFAKIQVFERAENIAHFVCDELITAGSVVNYDILKAEED